MNALNEAYWDNHPDPTLHHVRALRLASRNLLAALKREHPHIIAHLTGQTIKKAA